jgi:HPt (histidine-containing phosphotransfer) domain-containing protein
VMKKPDIVSLKWVIGLMNSQTDSAEAALVEYGTNPTQKQALLRCMWAVHQITSTLRTLGMRKAELLTMEMERSLNFLYKDKVVGERCNLAMGGLMQALKVIPAYLEHTENVRVDTGRGLEQYVNDLRRWVGERPRPSAFFFHMDIPQGAGITLQATPASDEEIRSRANVMLALYLEMAKQGLRKRNVADSMKNVARIARKMQILFAGTEAERFWFTLIGLCEGIAGGLIVPDECIAQIFKSGAFAIKYARENGAQIDDSIDYDNYMQQMLYYIASCKSRPVHISNIREVFCIDDDTISEAKRGLVHSDAIVVALSGALKQLNIVEAFLVHHDLAKIFQQKPEERDASPLSAIEAAEIRLVAAGQFGHADSLKKVQRQLKQFFNSAAPANLEKAVCDITGGIMEVKLDLEHKLQHGLSNSFSSKDFELRESVATATFKQMSLVENYLHQLLRCKALKNSLDRKPLDGASVLRLTTALQRHLNKTDTGDEELRKAVKDADDGDPDIDLLYDLARAYQDQLAVVPEREVVDSSLQLLEEISGALMFVGMEREGSVIEQCYKWLHAASEAGSVHEDDAFRCFADAFAHIEMHLQRSLIDPLDDTSHMIAYAEQRAANLENWIEALSPGRSVSEVPDTLGALEAQESALVQDSEMPPEFRDVFVEESEEIAAELSELAKIWLEEPETNEVLREIRRHFHTFKGNGRAVGANILGELGWAAQDMLDRSIDGHLVPGESVQKLVSEVVCALPSLVASYKTSDGPDVQYIRLLTSACFAMAALEAEDEAYDHPAIQKIIGSTGTMAHAPGAIEIMTH